jgi:hypothetical protein
MGLTVFAGCASEGASEATPRTVTGRLASCDSGNGNNLIGSVRVFNESSEEAVVSVGFEYLLADGSSVTAQPQTVTVASGSRGLASFSADVSGQQADSFMDHPDRFNSKNCRFSLLEMD